LTSPDPVLSLKEALMKLSLFLAIKAVISIVSGPALVSSQ